MTGKYQIVAELGEGSLTLPHLINPALVANDRAKYLIALLQAAKSHADDPETCTIDLKSERMACGIDEIEFDTLWKGLKVSFKIGGKDVAEHLPDAALMPGVAAIELDVRLEQLRRHCAGQADFTGRGTPARR